MNYVGALEIDVRCKSDVDGVVYADHSTSHAMSHAPGYQVNAGALGRLGGQTPDRQTWTDPQTVYQYRNAGGGVQRDQSDVVAMGRLPAAAVSHRRPFN